MDETHTTSCGEVSVCLSVCNSHSFFVFKDKEKYVLLKMHK